ncbi:MAG: class I SAM-dependent methyltransferase [Anaerolineaceae bacterium]
MIDDVSDIADKYNSNPAEEHSRLERHQLEYDMTWRYLERYLPKHCKILEIGAATGRYTLELARRGYSITAVDLSSALLTECRKNLQAAELASRVHLVEADARDLSLVTESDFDAVLLMGPLYHLVKLEDRKSALRQACDRLMKGGIMVSSFISRYGILGDILKKDPGWIEKGADVRSILARGRDVEDYPRGGFRGYFACVPEIAPLHEETGFETILLAGVEPVIASNDESYNQLSGSQRKLWLDLLVEVSTESSIIGASRHLLYIGKKK